MDDLTDDLLALAGDGDEVTVPVSLTKVSSPLPRHVSTPPQRGSPSQPLKGVARKMNKRARTNAAKAPLQLQEDEPSPPPSSHASLGSGAMSESEEDLASSNLTPPGDGSRYPVEGKFLSVKDRAEILAMPEARREQILSERMEELERDSFNRQLRQRHETQQSEIAKSAEKKKRKLTTADLDEPQRKVTKQKTKQNERLEDYKKQREQRNEQRQKDGDRRANDKRPNSRDSASSYSREGDSDVEWDEGRQRQSAKPEDAEAPLRHIERSRLGRTRFAAVCYVPGFDEAIKGCFTRVNIGPDPQTRENTYRMVRINAFKSGRPYAVEGVNGNIFYTDQYAVCGSGKSEKDYPFIYTSDAKITDREYDQYCQAAQADDIRLPTIAQVDVKLAAINSLLNHRWADQEISQKLKRQQDAHKHLVEIDRESFQERRARAVAKGDDREVEHVDRKLLALKNMTMHPRNGTPIQDKNVRPSAEKPLTQQDRIALINAQNRKANTEEIRRALLQEKKTEQKRQAAIARGEASANPFARVKTLVKTHHDANGSDKKLDDLFESGRSRSATPLPKALPKVPTANGSARKLKKKNDDDIIGDLDIDIDIDI